jgi:NAD(P)-dependent dehydrogenase (short-subunit alcohol dehydrogenase family)
MDAAPAIRGKTFVITGATSGIGLETALRIAAMGGSLALVGRDGARGEAALAAVKRQTPACEARFFCADLTRLDELRRLAEALLSALARIDVLINNAGAMFGRRAVSADGFELTFALNHVAYFVLTDLLRDRIVASAPARIVNVASEAHRSATLDFDDLQTKRNYSGWLAYRRSKLANILFTRELARRLNGSGVTANCLHPGFVASRFGDNNGGLYRLGIQVAKRLFAISPPDGAKTSVHVATAAEPGQVSGRYYSKEKQATPSPAAQDDVAALRLWEATAKLIADRAKLSPSD